MYDRPDLNDDQLEDRIQAAEEELRLAQQAAYAKTQALARRAGEREADRAEQALRTIKATRASDVATRATHWLWRGRIPLSGLSLIAGKGDTSKSTLLCQFSAWITTGDMKGEFYGVPRNVLYVVNEDSVEETVVPRLQVHGADTDRVFFIQTSTMLSEGEPLSLPRDIEILAKAIAQYDAAAVFIDPLSANTSGKKNDQGEMRNTYQAVNTLGMAMRCAIVGLAHTRKQGALDIMEAVMGSSEQTNVARSVHGLVMDDKEDGARILSCEKLNVGNRFELESLRFAVHSTTIPCTTGEFSEQPMIKWLAETSDTASDVLAAQLSGDPNKSEILAQKIRSHVMNNGGECSAADALAAVKADRVGSSTLNKARKMAGVKSRRDGDHWVWYFPS